MSQIKENSFICADCMEVLPQITDRFCDLVLTDPPYGITNIEWDNTEVVVSAFQEVIRISKAQLIFCNLELAVSLCHIVNYKYDLIWDKVMVTNIANAKKQPLRCHEHILVCGEPNYQPQCNGKAQAPFGKKTATSAHDTIGKMGLEYAVAVGYPKSIITKPRPNNLTDGGYHPTQKPVPLFTWLINNYSKPGDLIIDPFCGSGTTALACHKTGRRFICIDKEPEYIKIAEQRYKELIAQQDLFGSKDFGNSQNNAQQPHGENFEQIDMEL